MVRVILHGCNGKMGQVLTDLIRDEEEMEIVAGIDICGSGEKAYPVFPSLKDCGIPADVVIDFSNAAAIDALLADCVDKKLPVVLCTTGLSDTQLSAAEAASKQVAVLRSANMSLGINLLLKLVKEAAQVLAPAGFDVEIVEQHHNQKVDAPSGTALALADAVNEASDDTYTYTYDRSQKRSKRDAHEIGISSLRGGTIPGVHEVIYAGTDEVIEFKHTVYSKAVFGKGAIEAARYLAGKGPGYYDMSDVI